MCAISSGNHAQAVALSARELGIRAAILMPEDAPAAKLAAVEGYGAEIATYDRYSKPQVQAGREFAERRQMTFVPAYDDPRIAAGAGTAALELLEDAGELDLLLAPVGGGGLMAGCATVIKALYPGARVIGVEASGVVKRSLEAGERIQIPVPRHIADGQMLTQPGEWTFEVMRELVDDVVLFTDDEILAAMAFLFDRLKLVTEPSGAIATAALLAGHVEPAGARVGVLRVRRQRRARALPRPHAALGRASAPARPAAAAPARRSARSSARGPRAAGRSSRSGVMSTSISWPRTCDAEAQPRPTPPAAAARSAPRRRSRAARRSRRRARATCRRTRRCGCRRRCCRGGRARSTAQRVAGSSRSAASA